MSSEGSYGQTGADFDPRAAEVRENPPMAHAVASRMCPFHHVKDPEREFWITTDYADIRNNVLRDDVVTDWTFRYGNSLWTYAKNTGIVTDMPEHLFWRKFIGDAVLPSALRRLESRVEQMVDGLIDRMLEKDHGELHEDFALPLAGGVMCILLGAPFENYRLYKHWADEMMIGIYHETDGKRGIRTFEELAAHFGPMIEERREKLAAAGVTEPHPGHVGTILPEGFLSKCVTHQFEGRPFTDMEIFNMCSTLITAGQETTSTLIMNCVWRLLQDRGSLWEALVAEPALAEIAVEESVRLDPPVLGQFRTATQPVEIHGETLPQGAKLMFSLAAANRDEALFERPDEFRLDRSKSELRRHLSFGSGSHMCVGAPLSRMDSRIAVQRLAERLPSLRLEADGSPRRIIPWMNWGINHLEVAWG